MPPTNSSSTLHVPFPVLAIRPNQQQQQLQKSPGNLIEVRRHVTNCQELLSVYRHHQRQQSTNSLSQQQSSQNTNNNDDDQLPQSENRPGYSSSAASHFYGFVLWSSGQDDRRLSTWLPIDQIFFPDGTTCLADHDLFSSTSNNQHPKSYSLIAQQLINRRVRALIPFELRLRLITQAPRRELDFL